MMKSILKSFVLMLGAMLVPTSVYAQNIHGDVNGDREVNIADVNAVIDVILSHGSNAAADVNNDGEISVADVNAVIYIILRGNELPDEHEWVDLGLPSGTLWATCNVGANAPEEYGDHFAWGETEPKDFYDWSTYKWCNGTKYVLTKYCTENRYGLVDGKTELDFEDDAAWVNWGPSWRTPSHSQQEELHTYCYGQKTTRNGVEGFLLTGPNGNSIFIPNAGQFSYYSTEFLDGAYWSRTLLPYSPASAYYLYFYQGWSTNQATRRDIGYSVRAVRVSPAGSHDIHIEQQSLDLGGLTIGNTSTGRLTIANNTMQTVTLTATADEPFLFKLEEGTASSITVVVPKQSVIPVTVMFTATEPGQFNGQVTFQSPAFEGGQSVVPLHAFVLSDDYLQQEYVDLGLPSGTLWATRNLGASSPMDFGSHFAWGETEPKTSFDQSNYTCTGYNAQDNKLVLDPKDDAAWVNWGPSWRMPSLEQIKELDQNCSSQWTQINNIHGYLITGTNGNFMFLPAAGYGTGPSVDNGGSEGNYWTRTLRYNMEYDDWSKAYSLVFSSSYQHTNILGRELGANVRAVRASQNDVYIEQQSLDLGLVYVGDTSTGELTIINSSNEPITLTATTGEPFSFKQQDGSALTSMTIEVPCCSYAQVTVMFTASQPGDFNGGVTIQHPALDWGYCTIPVHARAYADSEQDYVDLGLPSGTLWATRNIGANTPEESGDFFAWGETEPKDEYYMGNYKWYDDDNELYTKYCTDSEYGVVDNKNELEPRDDAAWVNWGPSWRMPSSEQLIELREKCSWEWIKRNNVYGHLVTGPNGNTIFLPAAGDSFSSPNAQGYYWSRTLTREPDEAVCLAYQSQWAYLSNATRSLGYPVRAVRMSLEHFYIEQPSIDFVASVGDTCTSLLTIVNCCNFPLTVIGSVDEPFYFNWGGGLVSSVTYDVYGQLYVMQAISFIATTPGQYNSKVTFRSALDGTVIEVPISAYVFPDATPQQDAVDLGLPSGTLWATCNVGASSPEESGDAFAWGETEPVGEFDWFNAWNNYKWCNGSEDTMTKYCTDSQYGTVDNLTELEPEDDAAWVNWGPMWRIPSNEQFDELEENCTWKKATKNGVEGRLITGPNGNWIFLPATEYFDYWSRNLNPGISYYAFGRSFDETSTKWLFMWSPRFSGNYVRAVR